MQINELLVLARNIPKDALPEAGNYFTQYCKNLRDILHIKQEHVSAIDSSSGVKYVQVNSTGDVLPENNGKIKTPEDQTDIYSAVKQNEATNSFNSTDLETSAETSRQREEYSVEGEVIREAVAISTSDDCALKFTSSAKCDENFQKTETFSEPLERLVDRAINQEKNRYQGFLVKENIEGTVSS